MYLGILNEDYLIQAIFISLYIIVAAICLITIISENKTDVKMINERLKIIQKIKDLLRFQNWQVLMKNIQEIVLELIYMYLACINQKNIKKNLFELCC